ncbi:hypothetical protein [Alphaproteobacteria bacterium endosymbiont of Tiliacea citrago]|uniref:hypothetical protein n=1 Tax=Alphaproteobacteria bacterium endosymbiont of Tiliacea citrago TaxID=3077944 RepID=UPI00313B00DF
MKKILIISCAFNLKAPRVSHTESIQACNKKPKYKYNILDENDHFVLYDEKGSNFRKMDKDVPFILGLYYVSAIENELDRVIQTYEKEHFTPEQIANNHANAKMLGDAILQTHELISINEKNRKKSKTSKQNPKKADAAPTKRSR